MDVTDGSRGERNKDMQPLNWPGERDPDQWDVHDALQIPSTVFKTRFKAALLLSEDAVGCWQYLDAITENGQFIHAVQDGLASDLIQQHSYPLAILSELPVAPETELMQRAVLQFNASFKQHVFLCTLKFPALTDEIIIPPYLEFGLACLGVTATQQCIYSNEATKDGRTVAESVSASELFLAGHGLWGVMMEVDNREARLLETILAGSLFATYGMLDASSESWYKASSAIAGIATIARRLRLLGDDTLKVTQKLFLEHDAATSSSLMAYLFLIDVIQTLHCGYVARINTKELAMRMPSSTHSFNQLYNILISGAGALPSDLRSDEDGLLLLLGICADMVSSQQSFLSTTGSVETLEDSGANPFAPLSSASQIIGIQSTFDAALARWYENFKATSSKNTLLMYYFCRLLLAYPDVLQLPYFASYVPDSRPASGITKPIDKREAAVPADAMKFAWLILNDSDVRTSAKVNTYAVWLPVVLFYSALTIWYQICCQPSFPRVETGTLRILNVFKDELKELPWPCCVRMCLTLDNLLSEVTNA